MAQAVALRARLARDGRLGADTTAFRLLQGHREGLQGLSADVLGPVLLLQTAGSAPRGMVEQAAEYLRQGLAAHPELPQSSAVYWKRLSQQDKTAPVLVWGQEPAEPLVIRENGIAYQLDLSAGYSQGLFLDQRQNRERLRSLSTGLRVLNTFAYTCAFSVVAAAGGAAEVLSLDLSRPSLEWGQRNFELNGLDPARPEYDFLAGDVFHWLERFARKRREFDIVVLDPPTFSRTKDGAVFQVERGYPELVAAAARLLPPGGGCLLCCTNQRSLTPGRFLNLVRIGLRSARRGDLSLNLNLEDMPPDFAGDDGMKSLWVSAAGRDVPGNEA